LSSAWLTQRGRDHHATTPRAGARGAEAAGRPRLLVFDDISEIVSAQRAQAWGEVARRLAHEIKNPLTPIQLSAERLEMKLSGKLTGAEQAILTKSVKTIVDQVDAMKRLVNEFRDYARLPAAELQAAGPECAGDRQSCICMSANATVPVRMELDPRCPPSWATPSNCARWCTTCCRTPRTPPNRRVAESGEAFTARASSARWVESAGACAWWCRTAAGLSRDNILKRAFEPYVTTKSKGTGLGLAVVKKIADEHGRGSTLSNRLDDGVVRGAQVSLSFAVDSTRWRHTV
jgi:signal transduction histidine kinase